MPAQPARGQNCTKIAPSGEDVRTDSANRRLFFFELGAQFNCLKWGSPSRFINQEFETTSLATPRGRRLAGYHVQQKITTDQAQVAN